MKHAYMTNGVGGRCLAFVTAFSLCACSVLNIDVDEYKGPLSNHEDIQLQQYAALAISAKPIIVQLRSRYIEIGKNNHDQVCEKTNYDEYSGCRFEPEIVQFLNSILALYEDEHDVFEKESIELLRERNLAGAKLLESWTSETLKRNKNWNPFVKKPENQKTLEMHLAKIAILEQEILNGDTLEKQKKLEGRVTAKQEELEELEKLLKGGKKKSEETVANKQINFTDVEGGQIKSKGKEVESGQIRSEENVTDQQIASEEDELELEKLNNFIAHNSTLVNQSKGRGIHATKDIEDYISLRRSGGGDSKKFNSKGQSIYAASKGQNIDVVALEAQSRYTAGDIEGLKINVKRSNDGDSKKIDSKGRDIHTTKDIEDSISLGRSGSGDSKEFDCLTQEEKQLGIHDNARDTCGINRLTTNFIDSINKASASPNEGFKNEVRVAKERLNESLILFAEKILFIVNNHSLAFGNGTPNNNNSANDHNVSFDNGTANYDKATDDSYAKKFAVLQSLGNTLIVHANDLRRRAAHDQRLEDRKDSELAAAQHAFAPGAQNSFDNLVRDLEIAIQEKINKGASLQSAINAFPETEITKDKIDGLKRDLKAAAEAVQPKLDAYRTAFDDYKLGVEGIIQVDSLVTSDQRDIAGRFKLDDDKVYTVTEVLNKLKSWFDPSKTESQDNVPPPAPEYARRKHAKEYFEELLRKLSEYKDNFGIEDAPEARVFKKLGEYLRVGLNEGKHKLEDRQQVIDNNSQALDTYHKNKNELDKVSSVKGQLENTLKTIKSIKQTVLQQAEIAKAVDLSGLRHLLLLELKQQGVFATEQAEQEKFQAAHDMLAAMSIPKSLQFVGGSHVKTQRDVLDDVIAQLQQQRLEAASRGADITALNKALELAYEQRGGLAYLRSATAYLRNAFANTSMQDGNANCRNLLIPSIFCKDGYDEVFKETKLEIDKQFWQTINTIKVRGGGATDFAIVKDDVGNWYVKGLSSDPESIIKSAQSLALFNMGGKVNLDLLGQVETRRELAKLKIDDPNRQVLKDELKAKQSGSGANTAGLEKVLAKYRKEYLDATTMNVDGLIGKLDQLPIDIAAAWQGINFDETPKTSFGKLTALLGTPAELAVAKNLLDDAKAVLARAEALAAGTAKAAASEKANISASDAIVKSLVEVRNMRSRLVKAIIQNDEFIAAQREAYEGAKADLKAKDVTVADKKKEWEKADVDVTTKQALLDAMTGPAKVAEQQATLTTAKETLKKEQEALDKARDVHDADIHAARKKLSDVFKRKLDAQGKVDALTAGPDAADKAANLTTAKNILTGVENELAAAEKELAEISIPSKAVTDQIAKRDKAKEDLAVREGIFNNLTASSAIEGARTDLTTAKGKLATAKTDWERAEGALAGSRTSAKGAEDAYALAKSNRLAAARKVTILADSLIETTTANRLEAVKAYEVAIGFVGQTAGGQ